MKKLIGLFAAAAIAAPMFTGCGGSANVKVESGIDSLNYAFGFVNGYGMREYVLRDDSVNVDQKADLLAKGFGEAFKEMNDAEFIKNEAIRFVTSQGLDFVDADYDYEHWKSLMQGLEDEPERGARCLRCFTLRLTETARYAATHGFTLFTTTLASSRWKSLEQINEAGRRAAARYPDTLFWEQNWRKGGLQERRNQLLHEYDFYNQQYCGCEFSMRRLTEKNI